MCLSSSNADTLFIVYASIIIAPYLHKLLITLQPSGSIKVHISHMQWQYHPVPPYPLAFLFLYKLLKHNICPSPSHTTTSLASMLTHASSQRLCLGDSYREQAWQKKEMKALITLRSIVVIERDNIAFLQTSDQLIIQFPKINSRTCIHRTTQNSRELVPKTANWIKSKFKSEKISKLPLFILGTLLFSPWASPSSQQQVYVPTITVYQASRTPLHHKTATTNTPQ